MSGAVPPPAARPLERAARVPVCVCVRVRALLGRVGRAGLPGAFWCASPFPLAALSFCFAWPPPGWGCPPLSRCPCRSSLPWRCALILFLRLPLPGSSCARASFVSLAWPVAALWWFLPPPPPSLCLAVFVAPAWCLGVVVFFSFFFFFFFFFPFFFVLPGRVVVRLTFSFGRLVFLLCLAPSGLGVAPLPLAALAVPRCLGAVLWLFFSASGCLALRALAPRLCLPLGRWLLFGGFFPPPLPFLCLAVFVAPAWCLGVFFSFFSSPSSPVRPRCLRLSLVSGPGCPGPPRCALFVLLALRLSALRALVPLSCFLSGWWLLPGGCCSPPPFFCLAVFVAAARCCVPCAVLCCASLGAVLRRAAARCVLRCCAVLCCVVLVGCRCLLRRALWRCPLPWGPMLCGAVFCGVPPCCVCFVVARWCVLLFAALLCAVCVPGCCAVRSLSSPLFAVLCCAVLVRSRCAVLLVRAVAGACCCGVPWCGAGSGRPWFSAVACFDAWTTAWRV